MAYNPAKAQQIREFLLRKGVDFDEREMFIGISFMVDGKLCCGTHTDKKTGDDILLCRISDEAYEKAIETNGVTPMQLGGQKAQKNYIFVASDAYKSDKTFASWLQLCLDYNPMAKSSKKK